MLSYLCLGLYILSVLFYWFLFIAAEIYGVISSKRDIDFNNISCGIVCSLLPVFGTIGFISFCFYIFKFDISNFLTKKIYDFAGVKDKEVS